MNAAIVTIGDEILIGQVIDTNSAWIADKLTLAGILVKEIASISDSPGHITRTLDQFVGKVDCIIMTGGLGPTRDDLTKMAITEYFGGQLVMNTEVLEKITLFFERRGRKMIESNRQQAMLPNNCQVLPNDHGTAQGMWFNSNGTDIFSIPGVPYEMKPLVENHIIPVLLKSSQVPELVHRTVLTEGLPESFLAELIRRWEDELPGCMKLAYLPRPGIVRLRLTATGECSEDARKMVEERLNSLRHIIQDHIFGYDDDTLQGVVGHQLAELGLSLATAESCTGGNIARLVTSVPGSSRYFNGAIIAYSNEIKSKVLDVSNDTLTSDGAVSQKVVEQMARGVMKHLNSRTAIAVSGIAGPDGGDDVKPVGTVWIAVAMDNKIRTRKFQFAGNRSRIIDQSSLAGLGMLRKLLLGLK